MRTTIGRLRVAVGMVLTVFAVGTVGYVLLGLSPIDAVYMTVITITTVGYREIIGDDPTSVEKLFTMAIIVTGVSTVLYTFTLGVQVVVEGQLREFVGRRRMDKQIAEMRGHVIVCGLGRVGRAVVDDLERTGKQVVVIDIDDDRVRTRSSPTIVGDATLDATLRAAGIEHADALVAALEGDAENLFVTLSSRAIRDDLFIVARARQEESVAKLQRAGADRVVNPQELGAARMASFVARPHVAEFVDVVMHERSLEIRMQELAIDERSPLDGVSVRDADLRQRAGVLVLAIRRSDGTFMVNPDPDTVLSAGQVVIAVGTDDDLSRFEAVAR
ncbi:MAG: potassium channel family protein [Ilumatobacteraceae bacterium]